MQHVKECHGVVKALQRSFDAEVEQGSAVPEGGLVELAVQIRLTSRRHIIIPELHCSRLQLISSYGYSRKINERVSNNIDYPRTFFALP